MKQPSDTHPDGQRARLYFPPGSGEWEWLDAASQGWDLEKLDAVLEYAGQQRSTGIVILSRGRLVAERYWEVPPEEDEIEYPGLMAGKDASGRPLEDVASIQKSVVSFLCGVAERKGLLDIEAPVSLYLGTGWSRATQQQEADILVRHLLSMSSGLEEDLSYRAAAGTVFMYNTPAYSRLVPVLEKVSGLSIHDCTSRWLTSHLGMRDSRWWTRSEKVMVPWANVIGFVTSARDLARFGLLILADGRWEGTDLLQNPGYFDRMLSPSQPMNPAYGFLWWLNGSDVVVRGRNNTKATPPGLVPAAPQDLVAALGSLGRKCFVVPSLELVVTRLGDDPPDKEFQNEIWKRLMKAIPNSSHSMNGQ